MIAVGREAIWESDGEDCGVTAIAKDIRVFNRVVEGTCIKVWHYGFMDKGDQVGV